MMQICRWEERECFGAQIDRSGGQESLSVNVCTLPDAENTDSGGPLSSENAQAMEPGHAQISPRWKRSGEVRLLQACPQAVEK